MTKNAKIALGIAGALAAGAIIGLLLAPDKGSETRRKVSKTAGSWVDSLGRVFSNGRRHLEEEAQTKLQQGKAYAEEKANKLKESTLD